MDLELQGKRAIVTGGSRGIGKSIARALAAEGVDVAIVGRDRATLDLTAAEISEATGRKIVPIVADTGKDEDVRQMAAQAREALGGVDILVTCAAQAGGHAPVPKLNEITDEVFWGDVNIKVMGYLRCAREVAPLLVENGWGRIVMISGLAARRSGSIVGSIRNVGVAALAKNLADELGPRGVTVNCVHPGVTMTEKLPGAWEAQAAARGQSVDEVARRAVAQTTIGRVVDAREVADVVAFLCSPKSIAINGESIGAGGGSPGPIFY
ncbi:MAG: SDR family oxidoreductase [Dehalococcoidia bacterium]